MAQGAIGRVGFGARAGQQLQRRLGGVAKFVRTQPLGTVGLVICLFMVFMGVFAPLVERYSPTKIDPFADANPSAAHWFGTDEFGRDMYSRMVHGARISLIVAFSAIFLGTGGGYMLGLVSGYVGGRLDLILQRFIDAWLAFPSLLLALALIAVFQPGIDKVILAIAVTTMPRAARVSRGVAMSIKENVYTDAARVIGASPTRILLRHILPNSMAPFLILASLGLGGAILTEASLSYLGLGVPPPYPSWGRMLSGYATAHMTNAPWMVFIPGGAIMLIVLGFNLFGDSLRDIWDPKLRGR